MGKQKAPKPEPSEYDDVHFPRAGVDKAMAYGRQPVRPGPRSGQFMKTTADALNVRAFDSVTLRDRGGVRPGLTKFLATQVNGVWITQHLQVLVTTSQAGAVAQTSSSGRVVSLLAVSQGKVKVANPESTAWAASTNNTGEEPELNITGLMQSAQNNQKMYFADGTNYVFYAPTTNSVELWTPTKGELPKDEDGNYGRLICTWRGRTVISGLLLDPQNWFMSRVSDPNDWEYVSAENDAAQAVAGNNSPLGNIGDVVTALIPYTDDILVFGGDHTIYMMRGDPCAGGQIDLISDAIGMAWGQAWCKDPYGNLFFFSNKCGLYRFVPGQQAPVRVSQAIENLVQDTNTGDNTITMIWNDRFQGLHVWITASDAPSVTRHLFWEMRTNAWWPDQFGDSNFNPLCCVAFDGNRPDDRRLLIGSWDGYVRVLDPEATTDDGTAIASSVLLGPILTQEMDEMLLFDMQAILALGSGDITFAVYVGRTAEEALAAGPTITGTWSASRNLTTPVRRSGHAIYVKLSSSVPWAMEAIRMRFGGRGKVRRRN